MAIPASAAFAPAFSTPAALAFSVPSWTSTAVPATLSAVAPVPSHGRGDRASLAALLGRSTRLGAAAKLAGQDALQRLYIPRAATHGGTTLLGRERQAG